ncbi:hypothetical protein [Blastochloris tepida]|uniref:Uncharacterized protein n=1 Tax=Blastochloris tepida TaxID=2233851 RepID=A0A348G026_9HYPH|nr:hypothetical protein [Blastochloris tepida]BBF92909.1 hypothetical protein BLTE_15940 [Blastochloris tepida]
MIRPNKVAPDTGYSGERACSEAAYREALDALQGHIEIAHKVGGELAAIAKLFRLTWDCARRSGSDATEELLADLIEERGAHLVNLGGRAKRAMEHLLAFAPGAEVSR